MKTMRHDGKVFGNRVQLKASYEAFVLDSCGQYGGISKLLAKRSGKAMAKAGLRDLEAIRAYANRLEAIGYQVAIFHQLGDAIFPIGR